ncbi:MAG TPA: nuclear transport factor 2 family protein [Rhizomicrobium sp.]|jgi:ketosteroid isomerase-like protein|nr:nuclear transport factor 2 family protein [Rhizomicrobium sp.]
MKFLLTVMMAAAAMAACLNMPANAAAGDKSEIEALENQFAAAFNAKDVDAIMKVYVQGPSLFVFDVTPPRQHVGSDDYRKDWQAGLAMFKGPIKFELSDVAVTAVGDVGYGHSIQRVTGTDTKGKAVDVTVRVSDVYRKLAGKWLIVEEHVSVPVDLDTGKADLTSAP